MRNAVPPKPIYRVASVLALAGGILLLTVVAAPLWAVLAYILAFWGLLMYLLRWRRR
jgi:hypothetical protein